ncbi:MAG: hypothetical protein ACRD1E_06685, partial [Terriglobales bacterium]
APRRWWRMTAAASLLLCALAGLGIWRQHAAGEQQRQARVAARQLQQALQLAAVDLRRVQQRVQRLR